ncbi:DGQHR domain-containing protein [Abyssisolibacter fermentans]|uniref:DGQHR domain-containing protein n=1 Tax=Abyssisolibacter fermentans TaxID=1766203 RepID=UPI0008370657|nr:DGQHR domain-containing protein [Abyssisolibacter fermentans]
MSNTKWEKVVSCKELTQVKRKRAKEFIVHKERSIALPVLIEEGWVEYKKYKNDKFIGVKKDKKVDELFEDKIWIMLFNMGFEHMNSDRNFHMSYDHTNENITQQIDVFAADDESVLVVECKATSSIKDGVFKKNIEAFYGQTEGLRKEILQKFPRRKVKFIWATHNYNMSKADLEKLNNWNIDFWDNSKVNYYCELVKHLGSSAKYQLLGNLFANQKIRNMNNKIPAIRGKMGKHTYYSFSIEPEKLLKIGYVLHRNDANNDMMPTYQRIIKKSRLKSVRKFINEDKGYFPNSIVINLISKRPLSFDRANKQDVDSIATLGTLHLPQQYKSAYIIDGQHRLYGYSDSKYAKTNSIPVVAFENLEKEEQIKLFMEINENQKAVSKNLRNTLNADMQWNSSKYDERRNALRLRIAQKLGEDCTSPLYRRIIIGEEQSTSLKCVTIECIRQAINTGSFLSKYSTSNKLEKRGNFDLDDNNITFDLLYSYLQICLSYIKENLNKEWHLGKDEQGILVTNNGIGGVIRTINSITEHLIKINEINPLKDKPEVMADRAQYYLDPIIRFYENIDDEQRDNIRKTYGGNGPIYSCRCLEKAINYERNEFEPEGLKKYWEDHSKEYNNESIMMIREISNSVKQILKNAIQNKYKDNWTNAIPKPVYTRVNKALSEYEYETGKKSDFWDSITLSDLRLIVLYGRNWSNLFEGLFTLDSQQKISGGKKSKTEWLTLLSKLQRNAVKSNFSVRKDDYQLLCEIYNKFVQEVPLDYCKNS